ncbi:MAG: phosphoribosylanthranilate isomerase [Erysipelotrichaceae bacterium]|nr:phosphoribosylanthranilate isomerase [Erysipelotrichaceae bacterium]
MITQIYSIQTVQEALDCIAAGADRIGLAIDTGVKLPNQVSIDKAKEIFDAIGDKAKKVLICVTDSEEQLYDPVVYLKPDVIHICGYDYYATREFVKRIKELVDGIEVLQAIGIIDESSIEQASYYSEFVDMLILDSVDKNINGIGAAGFTNDWDIDALIVKQAKCRVILAGGLSPENVKEAILKVRPWGVDSFTKTSDILPDGSSVKNIEKVKAFIQNAKEAFALINE